MNITLIGGTGDIGEGLALRWAHDTEHEIRIGSRDPQKGIDSAAKYELELSSRGKDRKVIGGGNYEMTVGADIIILSVPPYHIVNTIDSILEAISPGAILVSPAVGLKKDDSGNFYSSPPPSTRSVTEHAAKAIPQEIPFVGAFHTLPAHRLSNLDAPLNFDTLVVGDDDVSKQTIIDLSQEIVGLRAVDAGGISNSAEVEGITPVLINISRLNEGMHELGVEFK